MALFSKKEEKKDVKPTEEAKVVGKEKKTVEKKSEKKTPTKSGKTRTYTKTPSRILKKPRITEKAAYGVEQGVYVFEVALDATKRDVMAMVKDVYKVTPRKINIIRRKPRVKIARSRRRWGTIAGMKKAMVFLKKGDKIDLM